MSFFVFFAVGTNILHCPHVLGERETEVSEGVTFHKSRHSVRLLGFADFQTPPNQQGAPHYLLVGARSARPVVYCVIQAQWQKVLVKIGFRQ